MLATVTGTAEINAEKSINNLAGVMETTFLKK
jgi:hypothetical protein